MAATTSPIDIALWEYMAVALYTFVVAIVYSRHKRVRIRSNPEYKYYLWGLYVKIIGAVGFSMIYVYYYGNGDTVSFFLSSIPLAKILAIDPLRFFEALVVDNSWENRYKIFDPSVGYPIGYVYIDDRTYFLVKLISPLTFISFHSFLLTGAIIGTLAFEGVWRLFRTLVRYYPSLTSKFAVAVLFMPSAVFWGSGIIKDTFTFSAMCWSIHALDNIFFRRWKVVYSWFQLIGCTLVLLAMKPYIFMVLLPSALLWLMYHRISQIRSGLVRLLVLPAGIVLFTFGSYFILVAMGDRLSKFSLNQALDTIITGQEDMKRNQRYGDNYFDLGPLDRSWVGVASKAPQAVIAGLYRPTLFDSRNVVMLIAALENLFLVALTVMALWKARIWHLVTLIRVNPMLQMFFFFVLVYAFIIGVSTPNFGALVRFKIPILPLLVSGLFIVVHIMNARNAEIRTGGRFNMGWYTDGEEGAQARRSTAILRARGRVVRNAHGPGKAQR
ncbi:MAG: hypothetical protein MUE88_01130 [Flavobacteriales bacterium]|nr:hypothetical protein [Flavobacteriales bacterium]